MAGCDLTIATGGPPMVRAAYGSGKPAYGVGAGNATMVIDETADIAEAARNTRISKTNDHGSGCSADGNLVVDASIYDALLTQLQVEGGYLVNEQEKGLLRTAYWDYDGRRTADTIARTAQVVAARRASAFRTDKKFLIVPEDTDRQGPSVLDGEAGNGARYLQVSKASTWRSTSSAAFSRPAGAGIRAASTHSTTSTCIDWR